MFQASFIKRASRQFSKSTIVVGSSAAALGIGIVGLSSLGYDDDDESNKSKLQQQFQQQQGLSNKVALCESSNNSVIGMLGDIQKKVRLLIMCVHSVSFYVVV